MKPSWGLLFGFNDLSRRVLAVFGLQGPCLGTTVQQVCTMPTPQRGPSLSCSGLGTEFPCFAGRSPSLPNRFPVNGRSMIYARSAIRIWDSLILKSGVLWTGRLSGDRPRVHGCRDGRLNKPEQVNLVLLRRGLKSIESLQCPEVSIADYILQSDGNRVSNRPSQFACWLDLRRERVSTGPAARPRSS
jgi:hypothetical protein